MSRTTNRHVALVAKLASASVESDRLRAEVRELKAERRHLRMLVDLAAENAYENPANRRNKMPLGDLRCRLRAALPKRRAGRERK